MAICSVMAQRNDLTDDFDVSRSGFVDSNPEARKVVGYPWFDWLRFALASIVVFDHGTVGTLPVIDGFMAVQVFFALSGWLIGSILLHTSAVELPRFFFNRATRIWIPYAVALILLYGLAAVKEGVDFYWVKHLIIDATFTQQIFSNSPAGQAAMPLAATGLYLWSIGVEELFYLFAPVVIVFLPRGRSLWVWFPIAILSCLTSFVATPVTMGVVAAILQRDFAIAEKPFVRLAALVAMLISAWVINFYGLTTVSAGVFSISVVLILAVAGKRQRMAVLFGGASFPLYLNHWIAIYVVNFVTKRFGISQGIGSALMIYAVAVAMALIMYWLIDRQIMHRRGGWYRRNIGRVLGATGYGLVALGISAGFVFGF